MQTSIYIKTKLIYKIKAELDRIKWIQAPKDNKPKDSFETIFEPALKLTVEHISRQDLSRRLDHEQSSEERRLSQLETAAINHLYEQIMSIRKELITSSIIRGALIEEITRKELITSRISQELISRISEELIDTCLISLYNELIDNIKIGLNYKELFRKYGEQDWFTNLTQIYITRNSEVDIQSITEQKLEAMSALERRDEVSTDKTNQASAAQDFLPYTQIGNIKIICSREFQRRYKINYGTETKEEVDIKSITEQKLEAMSALERRDEVSTDKTNHVQDKFITLPEQNKSFVPSECTIASLKHCLEAQDLPCPQSGFNLNMEKQAEEPAKFHPNTEEESKEESKTWLQTTQAREDMPQCSLHK